MVAAVEQRLAERGWEDGSNIKIEYRRGGGDIPQTMKFATEFVQQGVNVIVTSAFGVVDAKRATSTIPIVSAAYGDAVADGTVKRLARPCGNDLPSSLVYSAANALNC